MLVIISLILSPKVLDYFPSALAHSNTLTLHWDRFTVHSCTSNVNIVPYNSITIINSILTFF